MPGNQNNQEMAELFVEASKWSNEIGTLKMANLYECNYAKFIIESKTGNTIEITVSLKEKENE